MIKDFILEMFNKNGDISAPQVTGFIICIFACILTALHYQTAAIIPVFSTGMGLLGISGTIEVYTAKKYKK